MECPVCEGTQATFGVDNCGLLISAYVLAGLAMMLNIRLSYSSAPYALIRFRLPENLFSVFVRRMASALELWCLPSMLLGNIIDLIQKLYDGGPEIRAIMDKAGEIQTQAQEISTNAGSGTLKQPADDLKSAADTLSTVAKAQAFKEKYDAFAEAFDKADSSDLNKTNVQPHWENLKKIIDGANTNPINMNIKFYWIIVPSIVSQWLNFLTYVILWIVYVMGGDQGHLTTFYFVIAISGVVFGINMTLIYSVDFNYIPVYIAGENSFPMVTSFIHYLSTLMFGNRRKWNSDFLIVNIDIWVAIIISFLAAVVWTVGYLIELFDGSTGVDSMKHIYAFGFFAKPKSYLVSPCLMVIVGMGLVYAIYPGIAPGMIVPFYLVDKIEMILLIATAVPPVIIAILRKYKKEVGAIYTPACIWGPDEKGWGGQSYQNSGGGTPVDGYFWHAFDILIVIKITLAVIFICSLHYRESALSRSIVNQPKMSTALSIVFYMCHEILLALGFTGIVGGNNGGDLVLIPQYIGALFMIFLAFYSEGYIIEYKSHDPAHWPTEGMIM